MKTPVAILLFALLVGAAVAAPLYPCYHPAVAPVIDGEVAADPGWATIPGATGFSVLGDGYTYTKQTVARVCWTEAGLLFGVVCEEPDAGLLKPQVLDGGDTWAEDGIEIFIQPAGKPDVYQVAVTAGGAKGGFEGNPDITKMQAAAKIGADAYSLEALIPWSVCGVRGAGGAKWAGNVCRNIFTKRSGGDQFTCWAPLQAKFSEPENFAAQLLQDKVLTAEQCAQATEELNSGYRRTLLSQVSAAARGFAEYRTGLELAVQDRAHGEQAKALLASWQRLETISREADRASILDMRAALVQLEGLNRDSYKLHYRFLIDKLLSEN